MNELLKRARNIVLNGGLRTSYGTRQPTQYDDKGYEYFADATQLHREQMIQYTSDFFPGAMVQNWDRGGAWENVPLRMSNVIKPTAAINRAMDEYKMVLPEDPTINYLRPGTKIECMGSTWLVVNPDNISGGDGVAIARQCKAVWNHLDYYGNVVSEPIILDLDIFGHANASAPDTQTAQNIATGYYNVTCQYNEFTRQINDNTRLILGSKAYQVTGCVDFVQEFTSDQSSVRLVSFAVCVLTSADDSDDMENRVAGGKAFSWSGFISGPEEWGTEYGYRYYNIETTRNGENIRPTTEYSYHYVWSVDDESVAKIEAIGNELARLTPIQNGTVTITATLFQNPEIVFKKTVRIEAAKNCIRFVKTAPAAPLEPFQSVELTVYDYDDSGGIDDSAPFTFTASGAAEGSYRMEQTSTNTVLVTCICYSPTPLIVTAEYDGKTDSVQIELEDF